MRTDYFDGLFDDLPEPVTHVTQPKNERVTPEIDSVTSENNDLNKPLRMLRTLRTKKSNTEETEARRALRVFRYRLTDNPEAWLILLAPNSDLDEATATLRRRFGERLIEAKEYKRHAPAADGVNKGD